MIDAYDVEAFGLDPAWMTVSPHAPVAVPGRGRHRRGHASPARRTCPPAPARSPCTCAARTTATSSRSPRSTSTSGSAAAHVAARRPGDGHGRQQGVVPADRRQRGQRDRRRSGRRARTPRTSSRSTFEPPTVVLAARPARHRAGRRAAAGGRGSASPSRASLMFSLGDGIAAGDGDVRAAAAHRPLAALAARPDHGGGDLRRRAEHGRRPPRRRVVGRPGAARQGADAGRRRRPAGWRR